MNHNNQQENNNHIEHKYQKGNKIITGKYQFIPNIDAPYNGPYLVKKGWSNSTLPVQNKKYLNK